MRMTRILAGDARVFNRPRQAAALLGAAGAVSAAAALGLAPIAAAHGAASMVEGRIMAAYGETGPVRADGTRAVHFGVDVAAPTGTPIYAPAAGVVVAITSESDTAAYGNTLTLETQGARTLFAHLSSVSVAEGAQVLAGQEIARVGSTGRSTKPHVHIETRVNGERVDPVTVWPQLIKE